MRLASASEGYRPNGSGESGMTGESAFVEAPNMLGTVSGGYSPCSSASARCRARVSFEGASDLVDCR